MAQYSTVVEHNLQDTAIGKVTLAYRGQYVPPGMASLEIECEVYEVDGLLSVHSVCPKCRHAQWINGKNKKIDFDKDRGELHVQAFECPWEFDGDFGMGLCRMKLLYAGKVAREA